MTWACRKKRGKWRQPFPRKELRRKRKKNPDGKRYETTLSPVALSEAKEYHKQIDLVFLLDTSGSMDDKIAKCKKGMKTLVNHLYQAGISARVAVLSFDDYNNDIIRYTLEAAAGLKYRGNTTWFAVMLADEP